MFFVLVYGVECFSIRVENLKELVVACCLDNVMDAYREGSCHYIKDVWTNDDEYGEIIKNYIKDALDKIFERRKVQQPKDQDVWKAVVDIPVGESDTCESFVS
jgi:O6-methylguanine-DNA--protein-cysteine methyltransferase